ncbi:P-loop containing nucleoside triphosphate hydrolase protein [Leucosporidium creatinivorum]|uniref:p-loop containing nucleoside triphosphate hydrolase protein n=1 Tax=Leucosporidium creatinivorum TaxID=106004 RepID=A0A1Y2EPE9_9BASI|nr:P-loop containing nucleoside triphosphate hydrolase protein [Leucosporidium creatinivorum]
MSTNGNASYTEAAEKVILAAVSLAKEHANSNVAPAHLASALLNPNEQGGQSLFSSILTKAGAQADAVTRGLSRFIVRLPSQEPAPDDVSFSPATGKVLQAAHKISKEKNDTFVAQDHIILALSQDPSIAPILKEAGATYDAIKRAAEQVRGGKQVNSRGAEEGFEALSKYARDLTAEAEQGKLDPVIGRDNEIRRCIRILSRRSKNNPVCIGEPGVGKTAIAEGLAQRIVARDVPVNLLGRLFALDMGALMAGASYKGQFEERVKSVLDECEKSETGIILFIDEMHTLMAGQGGQGVDAANLLKPALARGKLRCIGATTLAEYRKYIEKDAAFERRFQQVMINEPTVPETISILRGIKEKYEVHHGCTILDASLVSAAQLAHRYLTSRKLPDSAIDLVDEAASGVAVARDSLPEEVDKLERAKLQLEIELHAIKSELAKNKKDEVAKQKVEDLQASISAIDEELQPIMARFQAEKAKSDEIQQVKRKIDELKAKAEDAERRYDLATAADIVHGALPDLAARLQVLENQKREEDAAMRASGGEALAGDVVTPEHIQAVVAQWSGIPVTSLRTSEKQKLLRMEKTLRKAVIGQEEAVKAVSDAIRLSRSGLSNQDRPIASFLFVGPSGTGKTELSKALARFLFDSPDAMVRIDGSEYSEKHSISRLIGSPPGYIGSEEGGQLTEYVRRKPYSVVLVDELEKASKEFVQLFLQVLDDGRLTDSQGRVVSFKNTVIIMTSNLGAAFLNELPDDGSAIPPATKELVNGAIRAHLPPEFINRLDSIVIYNRLSRKNVRSIVDVRIQEVQKRLHNNGRDITLELSPEALDFLGSIGYHPSYGARPLNRAIQSELLNPLSSLIISEAIRDGEVAKVEWDAKANRLVVTPNHDPIAMDVDEDDYDEDSDDAIEVEELD